MKSKRWLTLLTWLLLLALIVILLIPKGLSDEQLKQIKPGMSMQQVRELLGEPETRGICSAFSSNKRTEYLSSWFLPGKFFRQTMSVHIPSKTIVAFSDPPTPLPVHWTGKTLSLWVVHENDVVVKAWLFPIEYSGGGIKGCVDSLTRYWQEWVGK